MMCLDKLRHEPLSNANRDFYQLLYRLLTDVWQKPSGAVAFAELIQVQIIQTVPI